MTPLRLPGLRKVAVCLPDNAVTRRQLAGFAKAWMATREVLHQKGLGRLMDGRTIDVAVVRGQNFYARMYSDDVLCVSMPDFLQMDPVGTLVHELGHRVWFQVMRRRSRMAWASDHYRHKQAHGKFPASYAKTAAIEDHAEHFRLAVGDKLHGVPRVRYARLGPDHRTIRERLARNT